VLAAQAVVPHVLVRPPELVYKALAAAFVQEVK
jgi:hypothetical protein